MAHPRDVEHPFVHRDTDAERRVGLSLGMPYAILWTDSDGTRRIGPSWNRFESAVAGARRWYGRHPEQAPVLLYTRPSGRLTEVRYREPVLPSERRLAQGAA